MIARLKEDHPEISFRQLCRTFSVSRSWYYQKPTAAEQKASKDLDLRDVIEHIVLELPGYGYRRLTAELHRRGWTVYHKRVLRVMREESLVCQIRRRFVPSTDSAHAFGIHLNLIKDTELDSCGSSLPPLPRPIQVLESYPRGSGETSAHIPHLQARTTRTTRSRLPPLLAALDYISGRSGLLLRSAPSPIAPYRWMIAVCLLVLPPSGIEYSA